MQFANRKVKTYTKYMLLGVLQALQYYGDIISCYTNYKSTYIDMMDELRYQHLQKQKTTAISNLYNTNSSGRHSYNNKEDDEEEEVEYEEMSVEDVSKTASSFDSMLETDDDSDDLESDLDIGAFE